MKELKRSFAIRASALTHLPYPQASIR